MSRPFLEFVHPDDVDRARAAFTHLATGEDVIGFECRLVCVDGSVRRFEWNTLAFRHLGVLYGIARDVTVRSALADEQAALRRVATLVAQGASPHDLFEAVAEEVGRVLPVGSATVGRFEPDGSVTTVASWSTREAAFPTGRRWPTKGTNVAWMVLQTGRAARIDDFSAATDPIGVTAREAGIKSAVGSPIVVEGHLWGVMTATSTEGPMPPGTEARLARSRSSSRRRSRTRKARQSSPRRAEGSSPPQTMRAAGSSAICTTARSSAWSTR